MVRVAVASYVFVLAGLPAELRAALPAELLAGLSAELFVGLPVLVPVQVIVRLAGYRRLG